MNLELAVIIIGVLWFFTTTLVGALVSIYNARLKSVEVKTAEHEKRIQRGEDVNGVKLETMIGEVHGVKTDLKDISTSIILLTEKFSSLNANVHKAKNEENALNATLIGVNKTMLEVGNLIEKLHEKTD